MTTFAITHKKIFSFPAGAFTRRNSLSFIALNRRGVITLFLLGIAGGALAAYCASIFLTFQVGIAIKNTARAMAELSEAYTRAELALESRMNEFNEALAASLQLKRISGIKYVAPDRETAALSFPIR